MNFKTRLYNILEDISSHNRDRSTLLQLSVEERLNATLLNYDKQLADSYNYLAYSNGLTVLKKLNRRA